MVGIISSGGAQWARTRLQLVSFAALVGLALGTAAAHRLSGEPASPADETLHDRPHLQTNLQGQKPAELQPLTWIWHPPGEFVIGSDRYRPEDHPARLLDFFSEPPTPPNEGPKRRTTLTTGFWALKTKVTAEIYCAFLNDIEQPAECVSLNDFSSIVHWNEQYTPRKGAELAPANTVTWQGAVRFCEWLSINIGRRVILPTEAQWEYIARGSEGRQYPWGNEVVHGRVYSADPENLFFPVATFPDNATPKGVCDLIGHVREWCTDWYAYSYDKDDRVDPRGPRGPDYSKGRVLRAVEFRAAMRQPGDPNTDGESGVYGFRPIIVD